MSRNLYAALLLLALPGAMAVPAYALEIPDGIVINEVDLNPPGNDAAFISEWVELYNPTDSDVDVGGWKIISTTTLKKTMILPVGTIIGPGQFLTYSYQSLWFTDSNESVELRNQNGTVVDKTPLFADMANDFLSWQRIYDGLDSDSRDDWKFAKSTAGMSNGRPVATHTESRTTIAVSAQKDSYLFDETVMIRGSVSERLLVEKPFFSPEPILLTISGPSYTQSLVLYPDLNLNFDTSLALQRVLGIGGGTYEVTASYGGEEAKANFSVGFETAMQEGQEGQEETALDIAVDKSQYIPGETIMITGHTTDVVLYGGMEFSVTDPGGTEIAAGNLFPTDGRFHTSLYLTTVDPVYGKYMVAAKYVDKSVFTTFEVVEDRGEDTPISLWTDRTAYGLGDEVTVSGRLNQVWLGVLDLEIVQKKQSVAGTVPGLRIADSIRTMGDGSFTYKFSIPDGETGLGDYSIRVSQSIGSAATLVHVALNPDTIFVSDEPLTVQLDKEEYDMGQKMQISGRVLDTLDDSTTHNSVEITIIDEDGNSLETIGKPKDSNRSSGGITVGYGFTAVLDTSGRYSVDMDISRIIFSEGSYTVAAKYKKSVATAAFSVTKPPEPKAGTAIILDKDVYGLGETVNLSGTLPPGFSHVLISLTKPDIVNITSRASVDNQQFSWSWATPVKSDANLDVTAPHFGKYKITLSANSHSKDIFFQLSANPNHDSASPVTTFWHAIANEALLPNHDSASPVTVTTEKPLYRVGEKLKVTGDVILHKQDGQELVVPERVKISVIEGKSPFSLIQESMVRPDNSGRFSSIFELPVMVFADGSYIVKATYLGIRNETSFGIANEPASSTPVSLQVSTDRQQYHPGETVAVMGKPDSLFYVEGFEISVAQRPENGTACNPPSCKVSVFHARPDTTGSFVHEFAAPDSVGTYEITADAATAKGSVTFDVTERPQAPRVETVIEKGSRIPESEISIRVEKKDAGGGPVAPRVVSGMLITPSRGEESSVNLRVSSPSGTCIIGPDAGCLVKESTRKPGQIYEIVDADGISLKVRYSGPDVRLEKFSILPESPGTFLPDANWGVEVLKDEQVSRFYYKVTYRATG